MKTIETIILSGETLRYEFERKKVKNINLRVRSDGTVFVSANLRVPKTAVESFLQSKAKVILAAVENYKRKSADIPRYTDGSTLYILGKPHDLCVRAGNKNCVAEEDGVIAVTVKNIDDTALIKKTYFKWADAQCKRVIIEICNRFYAKYPDSVARFPEIRFRRMTSRYGSCNYKNGVLTFNLNLFEAPIGCIAFVVAHEFTHFAVPDHSAKFYRRLEIYLPDWKERKKLLDKRAYTK